MKKLMLGLMMAFAVTAEAEVISDVQIGGLIYSLDTEAKTATLTGYTGSPTKIEVKEVKYSNENYSVTSIGENAFYECTSLTEISAPLVTSVGKLAFASTSLETVSLPLVAIVGDGAFGACSLIEVSLPNAISIGASAFYVCRALTAVSLPKASTIGANACGFCESLKAVSAQLVTSIGEEAFTRCTSLETVSMPFVVTVKRAAFYDCASLKTLSLRLVTSIGEKAFEKCNALSSLVVNSEMAAEIEKNGKSYYGIWSTATITVFEPLSEEVVKAAGYEVKEAVVEAEYKITPSSVTLKSGDTVLDENDYVASCAFYGSTPQAKPETPDTPSADDFKVVSKDAQVIGSDEIAVKQTELQAAKAEAVTVADGVVSLGVTVNTNGNFTAETKDWAPVELTSDNVEVKDGKIVISIPVSDKSGFMILQSGDAKVQSNDAAPVAPIIEAEAEVGKPDPEGGN